MTITTDTSAITVGAASRNDRATATAVLTASFFDDPVTDWLVPDRARRPALLPPMFELYFDLFVVHEETYLAAGGAGVALWLPPDREMIAPDQLDAFGDAAAQMMGPDADRFFELGEFFDAHAPDEPHWHLQLLGTLPEHQGRGVGSALLRDQLPRLDQRGEAAYLEATTLRSRALYERHGFVCRGEIVLPDGPPLWQMWRSPR
jgi:ribosomal protein S18 acetylase RimI-like enzyme